MFLTGWPNTKVLTAQWSPDPSTRLENDKWIASKTRLGLHLFELT